MQILSFGSERRAGSDGVTAGRLAGDGEVCFMAFQQRKWSSPWPLLLALIIAMMHTAWPPACEAAPLLAADPPPSPPPSSPPRDPAQVELETRLRKMEESLRRMEEANTKIQSQYDSLRRKYDEMSKRNASDASKPSGANTAGRTRVASRVGAVETQEPPAGEARQGMGAEGMGGRTAPGGLSVRGCGRDRGPCTGDAGRRAASHGAGARWNDGALDLGREPTRRPGHWCPGN